MSQNQPKPATPTNSQNSPRQNQKKNFTSQKPNANNTRYTSGKKESRDAKRKRWAKRAKPVARPIVAPTLEYISACCNVPARKPRAGQVESVKDPDSGKMKSQPKGLGHWRCTGCNKVAKVRPQKPAAKEATAPATEVSVASVN